MERSNLISIKKKLDINLRTAIDDDRYKNYRVIIHCKALIDKIKAKIKSYGGELIGSIPEIECIFANISSKTIERLIEYPEIRHITFDDFAYLCSHNVTAANNVLFTQKLNYTGKGICVGLVDSGVYPHPDLMKPFKKIVKFKDIINSIEYPYDDNSHGTFMSGIICGSGFSSRGVNTGIAPNCSIYSIKAFNALGRGYISNILLSINTLISENKEFNIRIICLPFETTSEDAFIISMFHKLFTMCIDNNITVVVPSGSNEAVKGSIRGIAALSSCITVGGLDTSSAIKPYEFSSCGPCGNLIKPDFCAASADICSLNADIKYISQKNGMKVYPRKIENLYTTLSGTSCSAAYISGICALLYESSSDLRYKDIISLLKGSCKFLELPKWQQGEGFLDVSLLFP